MKAIKNKRGFTLIEMLIVLVIVSVLSLLIVPNISKTTENVDEEAEYALTRVIESQASIYKLENGTAPSTLAELEQGGYLTQEQVDKAEIWAITIP
ncbi:MULTISPECIES: competence type IV pilus major pilin ComGC [unclassified Jeotgalibaca]|uniref:competence type IV pilus major pilin ComGC n=1 Tax=unclassified Jeotgalibaca TaxID=2621505 RepID=UPI003FCEEC02